MFLFGKKYEYKVFIDGMSCGHCSARVEEGFNADKNFFAKVNLEEKAAYIRSKRAVTEEEIKSKVEEIGFNFVRIENIV